MKSMKKVSSLCILMSLLMACSQPDAQKTPEKKAPASQEEKTDEKQQVSTVDTKALVADINAERQRTEGMLEQLSKSEVSMDNMRAQIRQKWSRMHAYYEGDQLVRIKTYPHEGVSERSEEFYFMDGELVLAFIEDDGASSIGRDEARKGKAYYYHNGEVIHEENTSGEAENSIRNSDAERLQQEASEYQASLGD